MSKKQNNILINNVVPLNNGDVALFLSLYNALIKKDFKVKIATYYYKQAKKLYPNLPFVKELGDYKLFTKLPFLKPLLIPLLFILSKSYRNATAIIGAPGGYINSNYNIRNSLSVFKIAKCFKKKTFIYAQSVGPLNSKDSSYLKKLIHKSIDFTYVRDQFSFNVLDNLNILKGKFKLTNDAAFLLKSNATITTKSNKIAFSVRSWKYDNRNSKHYLTMMVELVKTAINYNYKIEFLSTCQGLKNYKNDAEMAEKIYNQLPKKYQEHTTIITNYYSFNDFYNKLHDYDFVVGTRLHMCITALTQMIPAFNISYEVKGIECFKYLGFSDYAIDYNEPLENALNTFRNFMNNQNEIAAKINIIIPEIHKKTMEDFNFFTNKYLNF